MRELMPNIYMSEVDLDIKDPPELNLIIVKGEDRSLVIDAGVPESQSPNCKKVLFDMIDSLHIPFDKLDCIVTHSHPDHVGCIHELQERGVRVFMNPEEKSHEDELIYFQVSTEENRKRIFKIVGLDEKKDPKVYESMWNFAEEIFGGLTSYLDFEFEPIRPGDHVHYGGYDFEIVSLKGHTCGQIGLYDEHKNVLFCADHIMRDIVPIVGTTKGTDDYLGAYLRVMSKVKHQYNGSLFIPGHGKEFIDAAKEADRIIYAYLDKCQIMVDILRKDNRWQSIREIGTKVYGRDAHQPNKKQFPTCILIWFKTYACLMYMKEQDLVKEKIVDGVPYWSAV